MPVVSEGERKAGTPRRVKALILLASATVTALLLMAASRPFELRLNANETLFYDLRVWGFGTIPQEGDSLFHVTCYGPFRVIRRYPRPQVLKG